jgi:uncharacterized protein HemY
LYLVYAELSPETQVERSRQITRWQQQAMGANVLAAMGALAATAGDHAAAVTHYSESLALKSSVLIRIRLARSFLALGDSDNALLHLQAL